MPISPTDDLGTHVAEVLSANYELESEIGRGGMGIVYCAKDKRLKREIAVKVLPPELSFRADIRQRFLREAETAAQLNHPNIVPIYTVEERDNLVYFVMAYIKGDNLGQRLQQHGPIPPVEVRRILREVADALSYAHNRNVAHRDGNGDRNPGIHVTRAVRRRFRYRWTERSLLTRRRRLSDALWSATLRRQQHAVHAGEASLGKADPG